MSLLSGKWVVPHRRPKRFNECRHTRCTAPVQVRDLPNDEYYAHICQEHQGCAPQCPGCEDRNECDLRRSLVPSCWIPVAEEDLKQLEAPVFSPKMPLKRLLNASRLPYEVVNDEERSKRHKIAAQLLGLNYRTEDLPAVLQDFAQWAGLEQRQAASTSTTLREILAFATQVKLSDNRLQVLLHFIKSDYSVREVKEVRDQILAGVAVSKPENRDTINLKHILATLIERKHERLRSSEGPISDQMPTLVVKLSIDAGRIYAGSGGETHMTIGSFEDPDRGEHHFKSRRSAHLFYAQTGALRGRGSCCINAADREGIARAARSGESGLP